MVQQDNSIGDLQRPINPFVSTEASKQVGRLSPIQRKLVRFIEEEAKSRIAQSEGFQAKKDAEEQQLNIRKQELEFAKKYGITVQEHEFLSELIFHGSISLSFRSVGHNFVVKNVSPQTFKNLVKLGKNLTTEQDFLEYKIKSVAASLVEIDGKKLNEELMEIFLRKAQKKILDLVYTMHILTEQYKSSLYEKIPSFCKTPTSRIRDMICRYVQVPINDSRLTNMSEEQSYWHYINAVKDKEVENEVANSRLEYLSWFINAEMAKKVAEKKELQKETELNTVQQYSFMNGILDMIKKDSPAEEQDAIMETIMRAMSSNNDDDEKAAKEIYEPLDTHKQNNIGGDQPFINGMKREDNPVQMGMVGGDSSWYR